jgi:hypothetical protein
LRRNARGFLADDLAADGSWRVSVLWRGFLANETPAGDD